MILSIVRGILEAFSVRKQRLERLGRPTFSRISQKENLKDLFQGKMRTKKKAKKQTPKKQTNKKINKKHTS